MSCNEGGCLVSTTTSELGRLLFSVYIGCAKYESNHEKIACGRSGGGIVSSKRG